MLTTGIHTCDALRELSLTGNIIPQIWYKVFVKRDLKNPKPHLLAINILADIVYWYRPTEVRDECTGAVIGYRKKFSGDMLQRSYAQIAEQFGCSVGQAKDAIVFLEQMGVVRREFRTIEAKGMNYNNIMFLDLDADRLRELTYPCAEISPEGCADSDTPMPEFHHRGAGISPEPVPEFHRYTENTIQENTTETTTKISNSLTDCLTDPRGRGDAQEQIADNPEAFVRELRKSESIPKSVALDLKKMRMLIHWLCEYDYFMRYASEKTGLGDAEHLQAFKLFTDCLCSMICAKGEQNYTGEIVRPGDVLDALMKVVPDLGCGELTEFAFSCVNVFCDAMENRNVQNVKGYMKSVIWNGFSEFPVNRESF